MAEKRRAAETHKVPQTGPSILTEPQVPPKPSRGSKVMNKIVGTALLVVAITLGLFFYWATANTDVLKVNNEPFPTRTIRNHTVAGGVIVLEVDFCKNLDVNGDLRISFVSLSREVFLPETREDNEKGCRKEEVPILIPKEIPPDTYVVKFRATYDINPLKQDVLQEFESLPFEINESGVNPKPKEESTP